METLEPDTATHVFMASLRQPDTAPGLSPCLHWSQTQRQDCLHGFTGARHGARTLFMTSLETPRHGARTVFMASLEPETAPGLFSWLH